MCVVITGILCLQSIQCSIVYLNLDPDLAYNVSLDMSIKGCRVTLLWSGKGLAIQQLLDGWFQHPAGVGGVGPRGFGRWPTTSGMR